MDTGYTANITKSRTGLLQRATEALKKLTSPLNDGRHAHPIVDMLTGEFLREACFIAGVNFLDNNVTVEKKDIQDQVTMVSISSAMVGDIPFKLVSIDGVTWFGQMEWFARQEKCVIGASPNLEYQGACMPVDLEESYDTDVRATVMEAYRNIKDHLDYSPFWLVDDLNKSTVFK